MSNTKYYRKHSKHEDFLANIGMRLVLAVVAFVIILFAQSYFTRIIFLSKVAFVFPSIVAVIVCMFPSTLNRMFSDKNEVRLSDVKEQSKRR